jgi:hypothetical protein
MSLLARQGTPILLIQPSSYPNKAFLRRRLFWRLLAAVSRTAAFKVFADREVGCVRYVNARDPMAILQEIFPKISFKPSSCGKSSLYQPSKGKVAVKRISF